MVFRLLDRFESFALAALLAVMTVVTFVQVVARYVFNDSFTWALELTVVCFAWLIFLGISYGIRIGSHIGVDAFVRLLPPRVGRFLAILAVLLCLVYCGYLGWGGWQYTAKLLKVGVLMQDLPIPRWIPTVIVPVGMALAALRFLQVLIRLITGQQMTLHLADEARESLESEINQSSKNGEGARQP